MAKEIIEKEIDGEKYSFYQLGAIQAHHLLLKIGKIVGPALGSLAGAEDNKGNINSIFDAKIDFEVVLEGLFARADEVILDSIILTLCKQIHHGGENGIGELKNKDIIDIHFKGRLPAMYKVLFTALEVQFGDFLGEGGILEKLKPNKRKDSIQEK